MKKLFFTLAILAGFAVQALAYDFESVAPTGQTLCYSIISDSTVYVDMVYYGVEGAVEIPETVSYNGVDYQVVGIGTNAFANQSGMTSVTLPNSLLYLAGFRGCSGLTSIEIPNSVIYIDSGSFEYCSALSSVSIGNSVTHIYGGAFYGCTALTSIVLPDAVSFIGEDAFYNCSSLTYVFFGASVETIGTYAFIGCGALETIEVSENNPFYKSMDGVLFDNDAKTLLYYPRGKSGEHYTVPNSVTAIGDNAFIYNTHIASVTLGETITSIGAFAFNACINLTEINLPNSVTTIGNAAFADCGALSSIVLPKYLTTINATVFSNCSSLQHIVIPRFVRWIKDSAFSKTGLSSVEFEGDMVESIEAAFSSCDNLTSIMLPNSLQRLSGGVFAKCSHLENVVLGSAVAAIGSYAFNECAALQTVTFMTITPPFDGGNSFSNCSDSIRLIVPCGAREAYEGFYEYVHFVEEDCNQHNINVIGDENGGQVALSVNSAMIGEEITYSVEVQPDYVFNGVVVYKADDETFRIPVADNKFVMPNFDVTVKADFEYLNIGEGQPEWYYEIQNENGSITYQHLEYAGDTTINHKEVTIIIRTNTLYDKGEHTETTREYIYEERTLRGNKVYWWNKDLQEFTVLYDFGAQQGDSWVIKVGTASLTMHVDAVEQYEYEGRVFRMLQVSDDQDLFSGTIVCGIGHLSSFFPERLMNRSKNYRVEGMRCYWRDGELFFKYGNRDCNEVYEEWHNGIEEDDPSTGSGTLTVYPNPTDGILNVRLPQCDSPTEYRISNMMGQTLMSGKITAEPQQIDVSDLPQGMYFITVGEGMRKFVVR